ncbi:hypothetical protein BO99DRAFT_16348 [Aspergillus violaceofuscus CBS 115571]|uniref:Uncharacterized protein n=1 Tax=Aspergillus violaceofuscus (strain CBS 115571) TaxID=1450538 RepID=A0A2V5H1D6_ASPV1|nr:hypothetical protein BO99DRAFT_16348 [Aspergillus violaceofuscus CBS 115571]
MPANPTFSLQSNKTASIPYSPESRVSVPEPSPFPGSNSFPSFSTSTHPPELVDSASSDDQSDTDPFHQPSFASDQENDDPEDDQDTDGSIVDAVDSHPSVSARSPPVQPTAAVTQTISTKDYHTQRGPVASSQENAYPVGRTGSSVSLASTGDTRTSDSTTADVSQSSLRSAGRVELGTPSSSESRPRPLASRAVNRDRMPPPPPPKSHHGRLINPSPGATSSHSQTTPGQSSNRFSLRGTPSEPSYSHCPAQPATDYFSGVETSRSAQSAPVDVLRRSQSQSKRPPTPPLSRRHSQMRRSKTTSAKVNPVRLSIPPEADPTAAAAAAAAAAPPSVAIPPPSPSSWSLYPTRTRDPRLASTPSEESVPSSSSSNRLSLQIDSSSTPWIPREPGRAASPSPSVKRASLQNPPPPPPRRSRGSGNHSPDSVRLSLRSSKPSVAAAKDDYVPHPSNANDILADLTRLQKEVDDLRGHYESRKASH